MLRFIGRTTVRTLVFRPKWKVAMAIQSLSYLDIPPGKRKTVVSTSIARLRESLSDPTLTPAQATKLRDRINHLERWVSGTLPVSEPTVLSKNEGA